jgi:hypothetical protein
MTGDLEAKRSLLLHTLECGIAVEGIGKAPEKKERLCNEIDRTRRCRTFAICTRSDAETMAVAGKKKPSTQHVFDAGMVPFLRYIMTVTLFFHHQSCNKHSEQEEEDAKRFFSSFRTIAHSGKAPPETSTFHPSLANHLEHE